MADLEFGRSKMTGGFQKSGFQTENFGSERDSGSGTKPPGSATAQAAGLQGILFIIVINTDTDNILLFP